jgi:hypothetical protein
MKVTIKGIIKESNDNRQRYYDKVSKVIRPPYFVDLQTLSVPEDEWVNVFISLYKEDVKVSSFFRDIQITGGIVTDKETNILYYEGDSGDYIMREFDKNNNVTYLYRTDGRGNDYWEKSIFNDQGESVYYENSNGKVSDVRDPNEINESMYSDKLIDKIIDTLKPPFRYDLESLGIPRDEWDGIISKVFNEDLVMKDIVDAIYVTDIYGQSRYMESKNGNYFIDEYDDNGNVIYKESNYPNSGTPTYKEWFTYGDGKLIDYIDSNGRGLDQYLKSSEYYSRKEGVKKRYGY